MSEVPGDAQVFQEFVALSLLPTVEQHVGASGTDEVKRFLEPILRIATPMPPNSGARERLPVSLPPSSGPNSQPSRTRATLTGQSSLPPTSGPTSQPTSSPAITPRPYSHVTRRSGNIQKPVVLIADVSVPDRTALAAFLESEGYDVIEADNVKAAVERSEGRFVRLALCDLGVPGMGGHYLAPQLRRAFGDAAPPVYEMTSDPQTSKRATGVAGVLSKPVKPDDLLFVLERVLGAPPASRSPARRDG